MKTTVITHQASLKLWASRISEQKASVSIQGKVTTSRENTRETNQTAKYQVSVMASQQKPTEGLSKLMDIMASYIEPLDSKGNAN